MESNLIDFFPDFEHFSYKIANTPEGSQLKAWSRLKECERRLEMYSFFQKLSDPSRAQHRIILNDSISAFLLTFESTVQFLRDEIFPFKHYGFGNWLGSIPAYDHIFRGLRTLRHFEAHIEHLDIPSTINLRLGGPDHSVSRIWRLPSLKSSDLKKLRSSPLKEEHLNDWNRAVAQSDVATIFSEGLSRLFAVLQAGEKRSRLSFSP
jgi:hypothetical protein